MCGDFRDSPSYHVHILVGSERQAGYRYARYIAADCSFPRNAHRVGGVGGGRGYQRYECGGVHSSVLVSF